MTGQRAYVDLVKKAASRHTLDLEEIICLLEAKEPEQYRQLYAAADVLRQRTMGDGVHLRAIIEFSSYCERNCCYCGLRRDNRTLQRYRMTPEAIVETALAAARLGFKTIVLQSGEEHRWSAADLCEIVSSIKSQADVAITLCIGERTYKEYAALFAAGADRYLLKHETANPKLYAQLHPDLHYDRRIQCLYWLRDIGYQVGAGNIIGLPGQTLEDIARDILLMQELDVEMAGIGPFIPHPQTPLAGAPPGDLELVCKTVAITRLLLPYIHLPATTATGTIDPMGREKVLQVGANVVMPNVTPTQYRPYYEIYPNKICVGEQALDCRRCIERRIHSIGRYVATGYGHTPKWDIAYHMKGVVQNDSL